MFVSLFFSFCCNSGILVARWGVLWRPLKFSFRNDIRLLQAIIRMHNFCTNISIEKKQQFNRQVPREAIGGDLKLKTPSDFDVHGECIANPEFQTDPVTDTQVPVQVLRQDGKGMRVVSGTSARRDALVTLVMIKNVQRPTSSRVRLASDVFL